MSEEPENIEKNYFWNSYPVKKVWTEKAKADISKETKDKRPKGTNKNCNLASNSSSSKGKKAKTLSTLIDQSSGTVPVGILWDRIDYSCAYDSLLVVLYNLWMSDQPYWNRVLSLYGGLCETLSKLLLSIEDKQMTVKLARDSIKLALRDRDPDLFRAGTGGVFISELVPCLLPDIECGLSVVSCDSCNVVIENENPLTFSVCTILLPNSARKRQVGFGYNIAHAMYTTKAPLPRR